MNGHIQGARNVPAAGVEGAGLPRDGKLVLYCSEASCALSSASVDKLLSAGYSNVFLLNGGLVAWSAKGYPVERTTKEARQKTVVVSAEEANKRLGSGAVALDVRPPPEFAAGHLPGARNMPLESLGSDLSDLPRDAEVIVYDRQVRRSRKAAELLQGAGYKASELSGGVAGWVHRGLPLEVE
jgi:rhodanese-related sulfurtransferase